MNKKEKREREIETERLEEKQLDCKITDLGALQAKPPAFIHLYVAFNIAKKV